MRNLGLDILRLVAVLLVLGRHLDLPDNAPRFLHIWKTGGWVGVDLFFVLSGFLVSGLLFRESRRTGTIRVTRFLIRRGFKIYPAFWVLIATTLLVTLLHKQPVPLKLLAGELLFLQNYLGGLWDHTWSLAVEEHFYLAIAWLCYRLTRPAGATEQPARAFDVIPRIYLVIATLCLSLRVANLWIDPVYSHQRYLFPTHIRIDSLLLGVLLSWLWHERNLEARLARVPAWLLVAGGCVCLAPPFFLPVEQHTWISIIGLNLLAAGAGLLVLASMRLPRSSHPALRFAGELGAASYSIYLWHLPVAVWGWSWLQQLTGSRDFGLYLTCYLGGSLAFGWFMNRLLEGPLLRLRDRLFPG
jgi:peptidoglycan/LPS O-acetylase OafA/YrhL